MTDDLSPDLGVNLSNLAHRYAGQSTLQVVPFTSAFEVSCFLLNGRILDAHRFTYIEAFTW